MASTHAPNEAQSSETLALPDPGDEVTAESVRLAFRQLAGRVKAIAATVLVGAGNGLIQSVNAWGIADTKGIGVGVSATSTSPADTAVGIIGNGARYGIQGNTLGSTLLHKAVVGLATLGEAVGVYGSSAGGYALEGQGNDGGKALLARGHMRFAQHTGTSSRVNPAIDAAHTNTLTALNTIKAWGRVKNGSLIDGFNVASFKYFGAAAEVILAAGFPTSLQFAVICQSHYPKLALGSQFVPVTVRPYASDEVAPYNRSTVRFTLFQGYSVADAATGIIVDQPKGFEVSDFSFIVLGRQNVEAD